nr:MAG: hypothetical protein DIU78_26790 [Pseudomonadota bacterium]
MPREERAARGTPQADGEGADAACGPPIAALAERRTLGGRDATHVIEEGTDVTESPGAGESATRCRIAEGCEAERAPAGRWRARASGAQGCRRSRERHEGVARGQPEGSDGCDRGR